MNLETKITIYKFTPQLFTLTRSYLTETNIRGPAEISHHQINKGAVLMCLSRIRYTEITLMKI